MHKGGRKKSSGVIAFSTMMGIALVVSTLAVALALIAFLEGLIGYGQSKANQAYFVAESGVNDALMILARDKAFTSAGYTLLVGPGTTTITVSTASQESTITSIGTVENRKKKLEVKASVDSYTGAIRIISWKEVSI